MALSTHLKDWMDYYQVTSEMISFKTGMSTKVIDKFVNCETTPSIAALKIISDTIGVSMDDIIDNTPETKISELESQDSMHIVETIKHDTAVCIQNYLAELGRTCRVIALVGDTEKFIIQYDGDMIDINVFHKVSKKFKYRDVRIKEFDEDKRYKDMELTRL